MSKVKKEKKKKKIITFLYFLALISEYCRLAIFSLCHSLADTKRQHILLHFKFLHLRTSTLIILISCPFLNSVSNPFHLRYTHIPTFCAIAKINTAEKSTVFCLLKKKNDWPKTLRLYSKFTDRGRKLTFTISLLSVSQTPEFFRKNAKIIRSPFIWSNFHIRIFHQLKHTHRHTHTHIPPHIHTYIHTYIPLHTYTHIFTHIHTYTPHTHTLTLNLPKNN